MARRGMPGAGATSPLLRRGPSNSGSALRGLPPVGRAGLDGLGFTSALAGAGMSAMEFDGVVVSESPRAFIQFPPLLAPAKAALETAPSTAPEKALVFTLSQ